MDSKIDQVKFVEDLKIFEVICSILIVYITLVNKGTYLYL